MLYRPLYGSRDAPYRWRLEISHVLRGNGFAQFRPDCCLFGKYRALKDDEKKHFPESANQYIDRIVMFHVDDILFVSDDKGCKDAERAPESFAHSGFVYLATDSPIVFSEWKYDYSLIWMWIYRDGISMAKFVCPLLKNLSRMMCFFSPMIASDATSNRSFAHAFGYTRLDLISYMKSVV